jgi:Ion transport protein
LLTAFDKPLTTFEGRLLSIRFLSIINEKFEIGNNYLHFLINQLTLENVQNVSEMVKVLVNFKCNPSLKNDEFDSPADLLDKKSKSLNLNPEVISLIHSRLRGGNREPTQIIIEHDSESEKSEQAFGTLMKSIEQFDEKKFIDGFEKFKDQLSQSESSRLLEAAIVRDLVDIVKTLFDGSPYVKESWHDGEFKLAPAFLACFLGHHRVLKVLLSESTLMFTCEKTRRNLLHQICSSFKIFMGDRQKCFDLVIADSRCTSVLVNAIDGEGRAPLFYACHNGFDNLAKELLRRGAYIGHESIIDCIDKEVLTEFLDECVKTSKDVRDKNCEITVDYRFLVAPKVLATSHSELEPAHLIANSSSLGDLTLHPVISSFLWFKWKRVNFIVYLNLLVYFCFMLFLGAFIIKHFHNSVQANANVSRFSDEDNKLNTPVFKTSIQRNLGSSENPTTLSIVRFNSEDSPVKVEREAPSILALIFGFSSSKTSESKRTRRSVGENSFNANFENDFYENATPYRICFFGVCLMTLYEIIQCVMSYKKYFLKLSNWLDIILLTLAFTVLLGTFKIDPENYKRVRAVTILVMAAQTIQLIAKISFMSMSLHMAIFKRVCVTFMKTLGLYLILILAFAMSFYTLDENDESDSSSNHNESSFSNPFMSIITVVRMMLSDFDTVNLDEKDPFKGVIFLLFVLLITVVLFNLLTALAISDTHEILKDAELVDTKKRISILNALEKMFAFFKLSFANIFPEMSSIMFQPNKSRVIYFKKNAKEPNELRIFVQNAGKIRNAINVCANKFKNWVTSKTEDKLSVKSIEKFVTIAKAQRELILNR